MRREQALTEQIQALRKSMTLVSAWRERTVLAEEERDQARFVARRLWEFIQLGCFLDDLSMGETDSPEWHLWIAGHIAGEVAEQSPWIADPGRSVGAGQAAGADRAGRSEAGLTPGAH